jgi:pimeloyl-ACP methyl ester carboxylesterase
MSEIQFVTTGTLRIAYEAHGPDAGTPIILLHGFPYSPRAFDEVAPPLAAAGHRVIVPYLRGYGPTRFLSPATPRSGQQAALAQDLLDLLDALTIERAALMGFDWGGRAACIAAALAPHRVSALVTAQGYNVQNIPASGAPLAPEAEHRLWYQYYFHAERGRAGLAANRAELCHLLWRLWSPSWRFSDADHAATATAFDNPDFVDVVIHSYRHRFALAPGDPAYQPMETALEMPPPIIVPTISLYGCDDGIRSPPEPDDELDKFKGFYQRRLLPAVGHNIPQEAPAATLAALREIVQPARQP